MTKLYPFNLLDDCHVQFDETAKWEDYDIDARELLSYQRFDLFANLIYIRAYHKQAGLEWAKKVYKARTSAITGYKLSEPGNENKNNFNDFVTTFNHLIDTFEETDFDSSKSIVPIDEDNVLIDGAHRVTCAAYFGKKVHVVKIRQKFHKDLTVPYSFFDVNLCGQSVLDAMAVEYCRWHKNLHVVFIWPKAFASDKKADADKVLESSTQVVYRKRLKLGYNSVRNLILEVYHNVPWMGSIEDGFKWSYTKADEVYSGNGEMEVVLVDEPRGLDYMVNLKAKLREIYNIGLFSVHSTDTYEEAYLAANLLFNDNSLHHLDFGHPDRFPKSWKLVMEYRQALLDSDCNMEDFIIDSSMPLALYGIRQAGDLDYLRNKDEKDPVIIENNDKHIENHDKHIYEYIYCPENYFVFMGLKVITLKVLHDYKKSRGEKKDLNDIKLMLPYLKSNSSKWDKRKAEWSSEYRIWKNNAKAKCIDISVKFLNNTHLYIPVRFLYRLLRKSQ